MNNFTQINIRKFCSLTAVIFSLAMLQACGARDEPFNGDDDGRGDEIEVVYLDGGTGPVTPVGDSSKLITIRDSLEYAAQWAKYSASQRNDSVDFQTSQVILVDAGRLRACDSRAAVERVDAYEADDNKIDFVINYMKSGGAVSSSSRSSSSSNSSSSSVSSSSSSNSSSASSTSTCSDATLVHHYYFYYIKSRNAVSFEDEVD